MLKETQLFSQYLAEVVRWISWWGLAVTTLPIVDNLLPKPAPRGLMATFQAQRLPKAALGGCASIAWSVCVGTPACRSSRRNTRGLRCWCCSFCEVVPVAGPKWTSTFFPLQHAPGNSIKLSRMLMLAISDFSLYICGKNYRLCMEKLHSRQGVISHFRFWKGGTYSCENMKPNNGKLVCSDLLTSLICISKT